MEIKNKKAYILSFAGLIVGVAPFSYMIGSFGHFFSWNSIVVPVAGLYGSVGLNLVLFLVRLAVRGLLHTNGLLFALLYTLPGLGAGLYWHVNTMIRVLIPVLCMLAFWAHPVGFAAGWYALYWLIPVIVQFFSSKKLFFDALAATFTAHAIGSVIWLYTIPMTVAEYMVLTPVVLVERLFCAAAITASVYLINYCTAWYVLQSSSKRLVASRAGA